MLVFCQREILLSHSVTSLEHISAMSAVLSLFLVLFGHLFHCFRPAFGYHNSICFKKCIGPPGYDSRPFFVGFVADSVCHSILVETACYSLNFSSVAMRIQFSELFVCLLRHVRFRISEIRSN